MITDFTIDDFNAANTETGGILLVDVWAPWCGPCKRMLPVLEQLMVEPEMSNIKFVKVNADEESELAGQFRTRSIPTLIIYNGGAEAARWEGGQDIDEIRTWITKVTENMT